MPARLRREEVRREHQSHSPSFAFPDYPMTTFSALSEARRVLTLESAAIDAVAERLGSSFERAVDLLFQVKGKVLFTGVGKSGLVARKISATFSSTGTPAMYLHPVDCMHGDLGVLSNHDAAVVISRSGHTEELVEIVPSLRRFGVPVIGVMASARSRLGRSCDVVIETGTLREACPFNLAPTASTTATMAVGDALAIVLLRLKGFGKEDFALLHQGGALGRRLHLRVSDLMVTGEALPRVGLRDSLRDAIVTMTSKKNLGMTTVVGKGRLVGILTDGDLRRILQKGHVDLQTPVERVMSRTPKTTTPETLAAHALAIMEKFEITSLVVVKGKKPVGVVQLNEILKAGVV